MTTPKATQAVEVTGEPREDHELVGCPWHSRFLPGCEHCQLTNGLPSPLRRPSPVAESTPSPDTERLARELEAAREVISAWESLPGPRHYSVQEVQVWLSGPMTKAINRLRTALSTPTDATAVEAEREVWPSFNINECVRVKLRARGLEHLRREHGELNKAAGGALRDWRPPDTDAEGWTKMQLWCVMRDLGGAVVMGRDTPFETTIQLDPAAIRARTKES